MSWHALIESISSRIEREEQDVMESEIDDMREAEIAGVSIADKLRGAIRQYVELSTHSAHHAGRLIAVGSNWALLERANRLVIVPTRAVLSLKGVTVASVDQSRFPETINMLLRRVVGQELVCGLKTGDEIAGVLKEVGVDFVALRQVAAFASPASTARAVFNPSGNSRRRVNGVGAYETGINEDPALDLLVALDGVDYIESGSLSDYWAR